MCIFAGMKLNIKICKDMKSSLLKNMLPVAFAMVCLAAGAQVREYDGQLSVGSIVRAVDGEHKLLYSHDALLQGSFVYEAQGQAYRFALPAGMTVSDFEIDDAGRVWFCGDHSGTPVVGTFDIAATFGGTGQVDYTLCTATGGKPVIPHTLTRMDIKRMGTLLVVAAVGEAMPRTPLPAEPEAMVLSVYCDFGTGDWPGVVSFDKGEQVRYTDIVALDNHIVAVGTDRQHLGCHVKTYWAGSAFPNQPCFLDLVFTVDHGSPTALPVLTAKVQGDVAATVQYDKDVYNLVQHDLAVDAWGNVSSVRTVVCKNPYPMPPGYSSAAMGIKEVRHSAAGGNLFALHRGYHSLAPFSVSPFAVDSWLVDFPRTVSSTGEVCRLDYGYGHSLDMAASGFPVISGSGYGTGFLHAYIRRTVENVACITLAPHTFTRMGATVGQVSSPERVCEFGWTNNTFYPVLKRVDMHQDCVH